MSMCPVCIERDHHQLQAALTAERQARETAEQERDALAERLEFLEADWWLEPWIATSFSLATRLHQLEHGGTPAKPWRDCQVGMCPILKSDADKIPEIVKRVRAGEQARAASVGEQPATSSPSDALAAALDLLERRWKALTDCVNEFEPEDMAACGERRDDLDTAITQLLAAFRDARGER